MLLIFLNTHKKYTDGRETICGVDPFTQKYWVETTYPNGTTERVDLTEEEFNTYVESEKEQHQELVMV